MVPCNAQYDFRTSHCFGIDPGVREKKKPLFLVITVHPRLWAAWLLNLNHQILMASASHSADRLEIQV